MPRPHQWDARVQFWLGAVIVAITALMQSVILFDNAKYTMASFGGAFLVVYISAAVCYITLPWIEDHIEEFAPVARTRLALLAFCFWIGAEATFHTSAAYAAPEGVTKLAGFFTGPETAKGIAILVAIAFVVMMIEVLSRLHYHGADLMKKNYRAVRRRKRQS